MFNQLADCVKCIVLILFFSSSPDAPRNTYKSATELLKDSKERWGGTGSKQSTTSEQKQDPIAGLPVAPVPVAGGKQDTVAGGKQDAIAGVKAPSDAAPIASQVGGQSPNPLASSPPTKLVPKPTEPKMNATFVTLARNSDVWEISRSIRQVEDRFNHQFNYDWVFLNDVDFDDTFKAITTSLVSGKTRYGKIPKEHWSFPDWIDQEKAASVREEMKAKKIIYGDSVSYRHMCRYESGFFFRHPIMLEYEWYWRVEPSIELFCDIKYDTFRYMAEHNKKYSFVLSLLEYIDTIPTLWDSTKKYINAHPEHMAEGNAMAFLSDDGGDTYNKCHFWSNFEIGYLNWLRSQQYMDYFEHLDKEGGFFYERWGDAPVHSIAASLLLKKEQIHFFEDISYYHVPFTHCPTSEEYRVEHRCHCDPGKNFDWNGYSCKHHHL